MSKVIQHVLLFVVVYLVLKYVYILMSRFEKTITIQYKDGVYGRYKKWYIVTDTDGNVYAIKNETLLGHFTSMELFSKLEVGKTYRVSGYGVRVPWLGLKPNITNVKG